MERSKRGKRSPHRRIIAMVLAVLMEFTMISTPVYATSTETQQLETMADAASAEQQNVTEQAAEPAEQETAVEQTEAAAVEQTGAADSFGLQEQINALPTIEQLSAMGIEEQNTVYGQL